MSSFVLVHGAWGGGWYWSHVATVMRREGHRVFTPTLTGLGERAHLGHADVNLDTHVKDVANLIEYEDLHDVVLVGHSLAGMVITGVSNELPDRLAHLIFLDADLPEHGQSRLDLQPETRDWWEDRAREGNGWRVNLDLPEAALLDSIPDPAVRAWYQKRSHGQGQPIETLRQPVRLTNPQARALPRTFIGCTVDTFGLRSGLYGRMAALAMKDPGTLYVEVEVNHFAPVTAPHVVARLLLDLTSRDAEDERAGAEPGKY